MQQAQSWHEADQPCPAAPHEVCCLECCLSGARPGSHTVAPCVCRATCSCPGGTPQALPHRPGLRPGAWPAPAAAAAGRGAGTSALDPGMSRQPCQICAGSGTLFAPGRHPWLPALAFHCHQTVPRLCQALTEAAPKHAGPPHLRCFALSGTHLTRGSLLKYRPIV